MNNKPTLFVIIGCDTDPADLPSFRIDVGLKEIVWKDSLQGILNVKTTIKFLEDNFNIHPKITWFLRSDWQTNEIYNDWCWFANKYLPIWKNYEADGDEIGWHPHLYRWTRDNGWYQEMLDFEWIENCLEQGYKYLSKIFTINSTRMGWHFHNEYTMSVLNRLGILIDLSALPGIRNNGYKGKFNIFDWTSTPDKPYHPSIWNYQCPDLDSMSIIELPITTANIPIWLCLGKSLITMNLQRRYEAEIAKHPCFFKQNILKSIGIASQVGHSFFVCYFHPHEILEKRALFSLSNFKSNLLLINKLAQKHEIDVQFITARQAIIIVKTYESSIDLCEEISV